MSHPTRSPRGEHRAQLRAAAALLWRRRLVLALVVGIVAATVAIGLAVSDRTYTARTRIAITPTELAQPAADYESLLRTVADVALTRPLLEDIVEAVPGTDVEGLQESIASGVVTGTLLVQVGVTDADPRRAAEIANAIAALLPDYDPSAGAARFEVTAPAAIPRRPTSPDIGLTLLAGSALALGLAVAIAVAYDRVARTIDSAGDLAGSDLRLLGTLGAEDLDGVPALEAGSGPFADFRALRVALEFATSEQPTRTLVVAPVVEDPAAGWVEVNLASALAQVGHRVLLIDADPADGSRHPVLEDAGVPGLYDLLAGESTLAEAVRPGPVPGVEVVGLGDAQLASPSLLEMRFRRFLDDLATDGHDELDGSDGAAPYDVIVLRAAPLTESDDARIMAIDGTLLASLPLGRVKPSVLDRAVADLRAVHLRVLGAVLTAPTGARA